MVFFSWSEWVKGGASGAPVLTGRHSAKSGMCVTRDHGVTHSKGGWNDSLRTQEKDAGVVRAGKNREKMEKESGLFLSAGTLNSRAEGADAVQILQLRHSQLGSSGARGSLHRGDEPFTG